MLALETKELPVLKIKAENRHRLKTIGKQNLNSI